MHSRPGSAAVWAGLRRLVDTLPNWNRWLTLRRLPAVARWRLWEAMESRRLLQVHGPAPYATVAVVVPTFRRHDMLRAAVESILAQTYRDVVVVVVDDGGGETAAVPDDPRVHVRTLRRNTRVLGLVNNMGIRQTRSAYVAILNDDNTWRPDHLAMAIEALQDQGIDMAYAGMCRRLSDGTVVDHLQRPFSRRAMLKHTLADSSTLVFRRFPGVHFSRVPRRREDFPMEDWEFLWRYSRKRQAHLVPATTVDYLIHDGSYLTHWQQFDQTQGSHKGR